MKKFIHFLRYLMIHIRKYILKYIHRYIDTCYICIQMYMHTVYTTWYINTASYMHIAVYIHINPYKMQNRSPVHKAMKTYNRSKQIQLTPCKYEDHSNEQRQTLYKQTICKLIHRIQELNTCCHQWATKTLHKHTTNKMQQNENLPLIQSNWNAAASIVLSCPCRSWELTQ